MPLYDYECTRCAHRFERIMKAGEAEPGVPRLRCEGDETAPRSVPDERLVEIPRRDGKTGQPG